MTSVVKLLPSGKKVRVEGTRATPGLLELRVIVRPVGGAAAERATNRFCVVVPTIVRLGGKKVRLAVTVTAAVAGV
jgi:hypothetical protein